MSKPKFSLREFIHTAIGPYRDLYPFLRPYTLQFTLALVFGALFGGATGLFPLVMNHVNTYVFPQGHNRAAILAGKDTATGADVNIALLYCSVIPFIFIIRSTFDFLNSYLMAWVSLRVLTDLRCKLYRHILSAAAIPNALHQRSTIHCGCAVSAASAGREELSITCKLRE